LSETKLDERRMQWFRWALGLTNMVVRDCDGRSGGIAILWRKGVDVTLRNFSKYHIDVDVREEDGKEWRFTGVYGEPQLEHKVKTWRTLRNLISTPVKPWLLAGYFNEILYAHEKEGGRQRGQQFMDNFRDALQECGVEDLGFEGDRFTWRNNNHRIEGYIRERLDRAVANHEWLEMFPNVKIINRDPAILTIDQLSLKLEWRRGCRGVVRAPTGLRQPGLRKRSARR